MNMISTGAFQTEMDASNKQDTLAKKFVAVWEKKNSKAARAGGVSLMALSLAACGSDDDTATTTTGTTTTTSTTTTTTAVNQSVVLTTGLDQAAGGAGADTISGTVGNAEPTITAGDSVTGGDGADTFAIISTGTTGTVAGVTMSGIETVRVSDTSTGATTVNMAGVTGVSTVESFGSAHTNTVSFTNVGALVELSLSNTSGAGAHTVTYSAATVLGTADVQAITLDNATNTGVTTIAGVETVNIAASGNSSGDFVLANASTVALTAADATTLTLTNAANTSLTAVTAAGAGAATLLVDYDLGELSVTGSAQADTFDLSSGAMGANDSLDGGDGSDTLLYQSTADVTSIAGTAATTVISNVEVLELEADDDAINGSAADFTIDLDTTEGVTSIVLDANDANATATSVFTLNDLNATQMGAISAQVAVGGADVRLDAKDGSGTADTATVSAALGSTSGTLTVTDSNNDIESITINATGDANQTISLAASLAAGSTAAAGTLTITGGAAARTMTIAGTASTADTIDMSGVLSDTTLTMGTVDATITGGSGDDDISFANTLTSADTIDLGAGNDRIIIDPSSNLVAAPTISNVEELEIGATGTVSLNLTGAGIPEIVLQAQAGVTNVATLVNMAGITTITADSGAANTSDDFNGLTLQGTGYAGTADAVTFNVTADTNDSTFGIMTLNGIEDVTINVTGDGDDEDATFNNITSTSLNNVTVTSSGYGASSVSTDIVLGAVNDGGSNTMLTFDASGTNTGVSVTLADMIASGSVTGSAYYDTISIVGSAANVTVSAGAGNDTITGSTGVDFLYGGAGNDTIDSGDTDTAATATQIFAGAGNDTVTVDEADIVTLGTGNDIVFIDSATTTNGTPDIVDLDFLDFASGQGGDVIDLGNAARAIAIDADYIAIAGTAAESLLAISTGTNVSVAAGLTILTATTGEAADVDSLANIITRLNDMAADGTTTTTDIVDGADNGDDFLLMIDDGTDTALVHVEGDTLAVALVSAEVDIVAIFRGVETSSFTSENFADFVI
jgi:hypothetical protein